MITHDDLIELGLTHSDERKYSYYYKKTYHRYEIIIELHKGKIQEVLLTSDELREIGEDSYDEIELYGIKTIEDLETLIRLYKGNDDNA